MIALPDKKVIFTAIKTTTVKFYAIIFSTLAILACKESKVSVATISEVSLKRHIETLASDEFMGRKPFTIGEEKTLEYLRSEAEKIGLAPGNGDSYFQDVPLIEINGTASDSLKLEGEQTLYLTLGDEYVAYTQRPEASVSIDKSELVFCGYGIVAPEYNWNDYAGIDMKGKTALVLVNDPGLGSEDSTFFKGNTMTYYGRWTYKYEEAARQGADGILIIHEATMAGYPWAVVRGAGSGAKLNLETLPYTPCKMQGWISLDAAKEIFTAAGMDLKASLQGARKPGFTPQPLPYQVTWNIQNEMKRDITQNVIGILRGSERPEEYIIFSAHWDHLGVGTAVDGDSIYNGAVDNASGTAALLSIAEAIAQEGPQERSIVFLWVTAEEQGLLGSEYYAAHPIYPVSKTVANLNIDGMYAFGPTKDLSVIGFGQSELETYAKKWATDQGRYVLPDQEPEKGYFFRSDHFNFAKVGIPALYAKGSAEHFEKGTTYATEQLSDYRTKRYHQPADEFDETFDVSGMVQDAQLYMNIAIELANSKEWPSWKEGSEFKSIRDKSLQEAGEE